MYAELMSNKLANQLVAVLLGLHFFLIISTFRDYGMSWDQPGLHEYGQTVVRFYTSLGRDDAAQTHELPRRRQVHKGTTPR